MVGLQQADGSKTAVHHLCRESLCERCKTDTFRVYGKQADFTMPSRRLSGGKSTASWLESVSQLCYMDKHRNEYAMVKAEVHLR